MGDLSDSMGRKYTLLISMLGITLSFLMMCFGVILPSLPLFLFGRAVSGLLSASQSIALATISDLSTKDNKALHLSYIALVQCGGFVAGPLLGGLLSKISLYFPLLMTGCLALIAALWIAFAFQETLSHKIQKSHGLSRFFQTFIEAYQNKKVRTLSLIFLSMQVGVGIYMSSILILLSTQFQYTPFSLGLFSGFMGVGLALGISLGLPYLIKKMDIETIVCFTLIITSLAQLFSSFAFSSITIWILAFFYAIAVEIAYSGMYTCFSSAADARSQGWVMGIAVSMVAIAWAIAGFTSQLSGWIGAHALIFLGALLLILATLGMCIYTHHQRRGGSRKGISGSKGR